VGESGRFLATPAQPAGKSMKLITNATRLRIREAVIFPPLLQHRKKTGCRACRAILPRDMLAS
jgi:hypothetical protein